jgi:hypothetical protein
MEQAQQQITYTQAQINNITQHNEQMRAQEDKHTQYATGLSARIDEFTENLLIVQAQINLRNIREPSPFEHDIDSMDNTIYGVVNRHLTAVKRDVLIHELYKMKSENVIHNALLL